MNAVATCVADSLMPLEQLLAEDLDTICRDAADELARLSGARVLVTGGGGFLGYYMVQSLLHWNRMHRGSAPIGVVVYENCLRGAPAWLEALRREPGLELRAHDIVQPLPRDLGHVDWVLHAAGIASPIHYRARPLECIDANVTGLRRLLDYAVEQAEAGVPLQGLVFFSSSEIYGDPVADAIPTPETYRGNVSCTGPRACYDEAKRFGETLCVTYADAKGVPVKIARPFNNYGPGLKISDGRVLPDFARDILADRDIVMLSDGSPTRTFCYVTDAIAGYYKVLVRGRPGEAYNIGIDKPEISVAEVAKLMAGTARELFDYRGQVRLGRAQEAAYLVDNPMRRCPVMDKARDELGFDPHVPVDEGMRRSLVWYHHNPAAEEG